MNTSCCNYFFNKYPVLDRLLKRLIWNSIIKQLIVSSDLIQFRIWEFNAGQHVVTIPYSVCGAEGDTRDK